jgi:CheY-like chemotaxis protein
MRRFPFMRDPSPARLGLPGRVLEQAKPVKRSALVVDDDVEIPKLVELALLRFNFEVNAVSDGAAALARLRSQVHDLVILDLGMAEIDGFEVLQVMKGDRRLRRIPVIVLTADNSQQALARSFGYGADDFVAKPFELKELGMRAYRLVQPLSSPPDFQHSPNESHVKIGRIPVNRF